MLTALSHRFDAIQTLRDEPGLIVARARADGQEVMLCHLPDLQGSPSDANRTVADRLKAGGAFGASPAQWHQGPAGVTWVVEADDGAFLDDWLAAGPPVPVAVALKLLHDLAQSLDMLHRQRILHLRLRPGCVRVVMAGAPSARLLAAEASPLEDAPSAQHDAARDHFGYSAPELSGRTSNHADARTDLYLLGLLAYRMLGGQLPFEADDALGWVHAHLVQQPEHLSLRRPEVPAPVADLVQALLAKDPAQRPPSARAVAHDLRGLLDVEGKGQHAAVLAPRARFALPRLVVGREREQAVLRDALVRVRAGAVEALVLSGPSGIGKSALVGAFQREQQASGAFFVSAKFDQLGSGRPYAALSQALAEVARVLQREPVGAWPGLRAIRSQPSALAALSPELAHALGWAVLESDIGPAQARQRLIAALIALLTALSNEQPVVLFLDDVQWSDAETLALVTAALSDRGMRRVLLVLGQRDDDGPAGVDPCAGIASALPLTRVPLQSLDEADVQRWLSAALPGGLAQPGVTLARLTLRSAGNPLFLGQLLNAMVLQGRLLPGNDGRWRMDEGPSGWDNLPDSALEAVTRRLHAMERENVEVLGVAAAMGSQFDARALAHVIGADLSDLQRLLAQAHAEDLLEPLGDGVGWRFIHDRLQQAAYELAPPQHRPARHLSIGRALRGHPDGDRWLFESCRHLNLAAHLLPGDEALALALLNHRAAGQARASAGFAQYAALMRSALAVLPANADLPAAQRVTLLYDACEALLLERDIAGSERLLVQAEALAQPGLERARGDELRIHWLIAQERAQEALVLGLAALARLGLRIDPARATMDTIWQLLRLKLLLRGRPVEGWIDAPESHDAHHLQLQRLVFATINVAHTLASPLYAVLGLAGTRQALDHGLTPWSWQPIAVAGHILSGVFGDIDTGYRLGELSVRLGTRFGTHSLSFNHLFYIMHWKVALADTLPPLRQCFEHGERSGNFEIAGYAAGMYMGVTWNAMQSLLALQDAVDECREFATRRGNDLALDCCATFDWLLGLLRGPALHGPIEPLRRERADGTRLPHDEIFELIHDELAVMLNVIVGHLGDDVVECAKRVRLNLHRLAGNFSSTLTHWFEALLHAERLHDKPNAASLRLVRSHLKRLRGWAAHCPANHSHRVASLEAMLASLAGREDAAALFAESIRLAQAHGFIGDAAVIAQCQSRCSARRGQLAQATRALEQAYEFHSTWGATAALRHLEAQQPGFTQRLDAKPQAMALDTATLIKASQAISAEREMTAVAERLLQQVMENAGARYGALLLEDQGRLVLASQRAEAGSRAEASIGVPLEQTLLPQGLLRSVRQSQQSATLIDACSAHAFGACERWQGHAAVSVLCVPVVAAGSVLGALYLENDLSAGCFTPERVSLANVLASQAAIALANARLFGQLGAAHETLQQANLRLEERVAERTRELEDNHGRLRKLERQLAADEERQRIMRDLHDGLGSQLFVTLSRVEREELDSGQISEALRACIADMRLVLEAMSPDGNDFMDSWGNFRFRWEAQLRAAGIVTTWEVETGDAALELPAPATLQLLRIAQEALTNVLKHARAGNVLVRLQRREGRLRLELQDDGRGLPESVTSGGRGLANMRARAMGLQASLRVEARARGTLIALEMPSA